jgi:tRNA-(ms[2]io[6]A)-hydroxylase
MSPGNAKIRRRAMLCLKLCTDAEWASDAIRQVDAILVDHAHCERKAASNALSLARRHPEDEDLVQALTELAREEDEHFRRVLVVVSTRGVTVGAPTVDVYAAELRRASRTLPRESIANPLVDRLLVAALIEARSCERFKLLAGAAVDPGDREVQTLWGELFAAEAGHYRTFFDLAVRAADGHRARIVGRLERLAELEAAIVLALSRRRDRPACPTIHG